MRIHVDVDYCIDYHNNSLNYNWWIGSVTVQATPKFADELYTIMMLALDDYNFVFAFVVIMVQDLVLAQHV